jgi:hypothetical protein
MLKRTWRLWGMGVAATLALFLVACNSNTILDAGVDAGDTLSFDVGGTDAAPDLVTTADAVVAPDTAVADVPVAPDLPPSDMTP